MARKAAEEGRRLLGELLVLETSTLLVTSASDREAPSVPEMIADLRETFATLTDLDRESRFSALGAAASGRAEAAADSAHQHVLARVAGYGKGVHEVIERVGGGDVAEV